MNEQNEKAAFVIGIILGWISLGIFIVFAPASLFGDAKQAIEQCEASLPRDRHCKLTALPVEGD